MDVLLFLIRLPVTFFFFHDIFSEVTQCMFCEKDLKNGPVELPCKHRLCQACYVNWCPRDRSGQCPQCKQVVPEDFDPADCEYGYVWVLRALLSAKDFSFYNDHCKVGRPIFRLWQKL